MSKFQGAFVAIVTPFIDGKVDEKGLVDLIEFHIANGTHGIVPCGTRPTRKAALSPVLAVMSIKSPPTTALLIRPHGIPNLVCWQLLPRTVVTVLLMQPISIS